jgi:energy-coupling factor transporter ATP-binding protein EcfA2
MRWRTPIGKLTYNCIMINKFHVDGFKSLFNVQVELGVVNVFIGPNGSGKSNLLEAIGVMGAAVHGSIEAETLRYRGVREGSPNSFRISLKSKQSQRIQFAAEGPGASYRIGFSSLPFLSNKLRWPIDSENLFDGNRVLMVRSRGSLNLPGLSPGHDPHRSAISEDTSAAILTLNLRHQDEDQTAAMFAVKFQDEEKVANAQSLLKLLEEYAIYTPTTPVLRGIAQDVAREPLGLGGSGLPQAIEEMLDRENGNLGPFDLNDLWELIDWAEDIYSTPTLQGRASENPILGDDNLKFLDKFMRRDRGTLSSYEASEGSLYVLFTLALLGHEASPRFVGIDNFDQALHPRLVRALTQIICDYLLKDGTRQLVASTHNPLVLDGLDLLDDRIRLFAVDRDLDGATQVNRVLVTDELMAQAESGLSLSRLWVMGRLGGVPKNL